MLEPLRVTLPKPEHHRRGGAHPLAMHLPHHREPLVGGALARADLLADLIAQDLRAAPRERVQPSRVQPRHSVDQAELGEAREVHDLRRGEGVQRDGEPRLDRAEQPLEPAQREVGMQPALQHDLRRAHGYRFLYLAQHLGLREHVALRMPRGTEEGAEAAAGEAHVGVVDVPVDDESADRLRVQPPAHHVGRRPHRGQRRAQQRPRGVRVETLPRKRGVERGGPWLGGG